jgi:peroxiredoxin
MSAAKTNQSAASHEADADAELVMAASSGAASRALRAGRRAPLFALKDTAGRLVALEDLLSDGPVVLHFFRGAWCSFGEQSLADFATTYQEVLALGANAVAIAPPCKLAKPSTPLPMRELSDIDMKVSRTYGLAFELPAGLRPRYEELGYTPPSTRKSGSWLVPLPATYLLDRDGVVALAFIDVDYRNHFDSGSLLRALKALQTGHSTRGRVSRISQ